VKFKASRLLAMAAGLVATGFACGPLETPVENARQAGEPSWQLDSNAAAAEQALVSGVLGGFRAAVADFLWLQVFGCSAEHDLPATESLLHLVTVVDPRPLYFWLNAARITACDMPVWRIESAGGCERLPRIAQERIERDQAERALALLDEAEKFHPASSALWIERANIELNRLHDPAAAAECYRRAWAQPGAPFYAARLHAELLRRLGRKAEALAWLVKLHPQLPAKNEAAGAALVLARIRALERELEVPELKRYRPTCR
jgi:tetratricopeptide (TPR) repeat protein